MMKLQAIVDSEGKVVGTVQVGKHELEQGGQIEVFAEPLEGQEIHDVEIDLEGQFAGIGVDELHQRVGELVRQARQRVL